VGREPALQMQTPEFKPSQKKRMRIEFPHFSIYRPELDPKEGKDS
jgi:hypothetical protein